MSPLTARALAARLWEIRLSLSFATSDVEAVAKIQHATRALDTLRSEVLLNDLVAREVGGHAADG